MKIFWFNDRAESVSLRHQFLGNVIATIKPSTGQQVEVPDPPEGVALFIKEWDNNTVFIDYIEEKQG